MVRNVGLNGDPVMIRSAVIMSSYTPSLINFRGDLLREFAHRGIALTAVGPDRDPRTEAELEAMGVRFVTIPIDRAGQSPLRDGRALVAMVRLLKDTRPDLLLLYTIKPVIYGSIAGRLARTPRICSLITGAGSLFMTPDRRRISSFPLVRALYRYALSGNTRVLFQNRDDRELFCGQGLVARSKTAVVSGSGVNLERFPRAPITGGGTRFLLIARLLAEKGLREFAAAAKIVKARHPETTFTIVGPAENHPHAIGPNEVDTWRKGGIVEYCGATEDVLPHLRDCTVYVLPSYREGTPRSVLEAMAVGRPIITTDAPGCRETVRDGVNGFLVPVRDVERLADAMTRFVNDPALVERMSAESRRLVEERFDVHLVNRQIIGELGLS